MKCSYILLITTFSVFIHSSVAQQIIGRLVDENTNGLPQVNVTIYLGQKSYQAQTDSTGNFAFEGITNVEDELLPNGYSVSDNYPNPFNPKTRLNINMPQEGNVKVLIYNLIGQQVADKIEKQFSAGSHFLDLELNGLSNGVYIARFTIDDKYSVSKKMMLIYGSQHLISNELTNLNVNRNVFPKYNLIEAQIDSLVASNSIIGRKLFNSLPAFTGQFLDLGDLEIIRYCIDFPTINYSGKIYNTVQIGNQCWLKENLDIGQFYQGSFEMRNNGIIEKYCYDNNTENCENYGGLYQWDELMKYTEQEGVQGICPDGWHIPTGSEIEQLQTTLNSDANALKARDQGTGSGTGTNASGFSALLSGSRGTLGSFGGITERTNFWSSSGETASGVKTLFVNASSSNILMLINAKSSGFSVRCIKGDGVIVNSPPLEPTLPLPQNGAVGVSKFIGLNWFSADPDNDQLYHDIYFGTTADPQLLISGLDSTFYDPGFLLPNTQYYWKVISKDLEYGTESPLWTFTTGGTTPTGSPCFETPTLIYDGKLYNTVQIGNQCWMRENLDAGVMILGPQEMTNNNLLEKYCFNDNQDSCNIYGGFYQWNEAMQYSLSSGTKGICPEGWHIPSMAEIEFLVSAVNNSGNALKDIGQGIGSGAGTNTSGFSALLAGDRGIDGNYYDFADFANFWSSDEFNLTNSNYFYLEDNNGAIGRFNYNKHFGFSVRCIKD